MKFYHSNQADIAGVSSFVYNAHGDDVIVFDDVQGYSLSSALVKFDIPHVDILKLDCKGCEFFIKQKDLEKLKKFEEDCFSRCFMTF